MKFQALDRDPSPRYTGNLNAAHKWGLPGVERCPVCDLPPENPWSLCMRREALERLRSAGVRGLTGCPTQVRPGDGQVALALVLGLIAETGRLLLQPDTNILIRCWPLHRSAQHWKDPERFDPSRWQGSTLEQNPVGSAYFFPFGR